MLIDEKIVVTAALPYSNGELHLGHIVSTYLPADIFVRYLRHRGADVVFVCGGDDYGTPILIQAEKEGRSPEDYVEYWHQQHIRDFNDAGISFNLYYKTHSKENIELTQHFFKTLYGKGYIYTREIEQYYCEYDDKFLPDRYVRGVCPFCGASDQYGDGCEKCGRTYEPIDLVDPRCAICGKPPLRRRSVHYFLRLSAFSNKLREWLESNGNLQVDVKNYVLSWIENGLRDWDITRDIRWGVPIPLEEAKGKVLYGWFDNHIGYIAFTLRYFEDIGMGKDYGREFWNKAKIYHFIGKDIVYHHYLFLPAMRMGEGSFKLPDYIPTRGHLLLQGHKFSKSRGWYVSLREFLNLFPADYLRFYLALITPYSQADVNFDWDEFQSKINSELINNIGNFIHRTLTFTWRSFNGRVPKPGGYDELDSEMLIQIKDLEVDLTKLMDSLEFDKALRRIIEFSSFCNQYFQRKEPWKTVDPNCIYLSINATRTLAIVLDPFIPFSMRKLWNMLNMPGNIHNEYWSTAFKLEVREGHEISKPQPLFRRIEDDEIKAQKEKLKTIEDKNQL